MTRKVIKNGLCYINDGWFRTNILIEDEIIKDISTNDFEADEVIDGTSYNIIPGLIDPHVHLSLDCGTITSRDDFESGSRSAIYGGITTIIDFLDPSKNIEELEESFKRIKLGEESYIDYHFHGCIKEPDCDLEEYMKALLAKGIRTIKLFTTYSETHRKTNFEDIEKLLFLSKKYKFLVVAHVENDDSIIRNDTFLATDISKARPSKAELLDTLKLAELVKKTEGYLYIVHLSSGYTLTKLVEDYKELLGKNLFIESCPQYFYFDNSVLHQTDGCLFTFAPPLRNKEEKELLIRNIDYINTIGTDHCSFNKKDKQCIKKLNGHPFGIGGLETSFLLLHRMFGDKVINKMSKNIALLEGFPKKGEIKIGSDADFVFYRNCPEYIVGKPHGNVDYSIYEGLNLGEEIVHVMNRGQFVLYNKKVIYKKGKYLISKEAAL